MSSKAEYLKKYLSNSSGDQEKKKKKKNKENKDKPKGLRLIEEDAFLSVEAAKAKEIGSDEELEEIEVLKQSVKKAKVVHGFKKTFAEVEVKKEIKEEPLSPENSPPRNSRQRHDSDNSPPRAARKRHDSDNSPPRVPRRRHDSDSDNSPPRRSGGGNRQRHDSDNSPPRRSGRDESPPRRQRQRHDSDNSPPRAARRRHDSDNSPPRRGGRDKSPPRRPRTRHDSDNSPPRKRGTDRDSSPPRRKKQDDDLSPPRKSRRIEEPKKIKKEEPDSDTERSGKTLEGKRAGLQSAKDLKEESDRLRTKNSKMYEELDSSVSGRFADTVYRQKQTKKKGQDSEEDQARKEREAKKTEELKEKYKSWNRGVAQIDERKEQLEEMARVAAEPMARARDDEAMNAHLKEVLHAADPMAAMIQKKRRDTAIDRGELVYPTYHGHWTPNRFGIAPGYRWDGVDRSNGFEGKLAKTANTRAANQSEYYKSIAEYE